MNAHDIVVIGASAGGIEALTQLVAGLPADLPAAVFIAQHTAAGFQSRLPEMLTARGPLRATHAIHGENIAPGRIYVAPPDNHVLVRPGYMNVVRGPKENGHRPSVDALFRTAAMAYGARVVGVVLTGYLDCGTAGLLSIKARGGVAIVQDPETAAVPDMPASAMRHVAVDHVVHLADIARLVDEVTRTPAGAADERALSSALHEVEGDERGAPVEIVCPLCRGSLTEGTVNGFSVFRCHVGHAFSLGTLVEEQAEETERAIWSAIRALEESAALAGRLAERAPPAMAANFEEKERAQLQDAARLRALLLSGSAIERGDAARFAGGEPAHEPRPRPAVRAAHEGRRRKT